MADQKRHKIKEIKGSLSKSLQRPKPDDSPTVTKNEISTRLSQCIYSIENAIHYHCLYERKSSSFDSSVSSEAVHKGFNRAS